jgi:hypothetical protein
MYEKLFHLTDGLTIQHVIVYMRLFQVWEQFVPSQLITEV